jgi:hypothetical protein
VTQTFLAARSSQDLAPVLRLLARSGRPRARGDARVLTSAVPGWLLLARPELLPPVPPPWIELLARVEEQTGDGPTLAVMTAADLGPTLSIPLAGVPLMPAPERVTVALSFDPRGLLVTGAAVFPTEAHAALFVDGVEAARRELLGSFTGRLLLGSLNAAGAVQRLAVARDAGFVTFSTSLSNGEAELLLHQATLMAQRFFLGGQHR